MGTLIVPADMYRVLAAEFMIWSMACMAKLNVMNSTTGRKPAMAAPQLIPVNPAYITLHSQLIHKQAVIEGLKQIAGFLMVIRSSAVHAQPEQVSHRTHGLL